MGNGWPGQTSPGLRSLEPDPECECRVPWEKNIGSFEPPWPDWRLLVLPALHLVVSLPWQVIPQQLLGQVCQAEGERTWMGRWQGFLGWVPCCHQAIPALSRTCFVCNLGQGAPQFAHLEMGVIITPPSICHSVCTYSSHPL